MYKKPGTRCITEDDPVMRHILNFESVKTYEGTHDIHTPVLDTYRHTSLLKANG
jgi:hypothetical protein